MRFDPWPCSSGWRSGVTMSCGVGLRCGLDPTLLCLCLWHRLVASASIGPLAWEPPYAMGVALKRQKKKKKEKERKRKPQIVATHQQSFWFSRCRMGPRRCIADSSQELRVQMLRRAFGVFECVSPNALRHTMISDKVSVECFPPPPCTCNTHI